MKSGSKKSLAAAALCFAALNATGVAREGFHPPRGISQAYRQLFQKKRQDSTEIYAFRGLEAECIGSVAPGARFQFNRQA
jgi:hypothetical protein